VSFMSQPPLAPNHQDHAADVVEHQPVGRDALLHI